MEKVTIINDYTKLVTYSYNTHKLRIIPPNYDYVGLYLCIPINTKKNSYKDDLEVITDYFKVIENIELLIGGNSIYVIDIDYVTLFGDIKITDSFYEINMFSPFNVTLFPINMLRYHPIELIMTFTQSDLKIIFKQYIIKNKIIKKLIMKQNISALINELSHTISIQNVDNKTIFTENQGIKSIYSYTHKYMITLFPPINSFFEFMYITKEKYESNHYVVNTTARSLLVQHGETYLLPTSDIHNVVSQHNEITIYINVNKLTSGIILYNDEYNDFIEDCCFINMNKFTEIKAIQYNLLTKDICFSDTEYHRILGCYFDRTSTSLIIDYLKTTVFYYLNLNVIRSNMNLITRFKPIIDISHGMSNELLFGNINNSVITLKLNRKPKTFKMLNILCNLFNISNGAGNLVF